MQQENESKLYVGNLPYAIDDNKLAELFSSIEGVKVAEARVITDRASGRSKGFGFVTLENPQMAQTAIEAMNGKEVEGRKIIVNISRPQRTDGDRGRQRGSGNSQSNR